MGAKKTFRDRLKKGFKRLEAKIDDGGTRSRAVIKLGRFLMGGVLTNRSTIQEVKSQVEQASNDHQDALRGLGDTFEQATTTISDQYRGLSLRFETVERASRDATLAVEEMKEAHEVSEPVRQDVDNLKNAYANLRDDVDGLAQTEVNDLVEQLKDALGQVDTIKEQVNDTLTQLHDALARVAEREEQAALQPVQVVETPAEVSEPEPVTSVEVPEPVEDGAQVSRPPLAVVPPRREVQVIEVTPVEVPEVEVAPDPQVSEEVQLTERADALEAALKPVLIDAGFNLEDDEEENNVPLGEQVPGLREAVEALEMRVGLREEDDSQETVEDTRPFVVQLTELEKNFKKAKETWDEMNTDETSEGD
jgi:hypothetical protein